MSAFKRIASLTILCNDFRSTALCVDVTFLELWAFSLDGLLLCLSTVDWCSLMAQNLTVWLTIALQLSRQTRPTFSRKSSEFHFHSSHFQFHFPATLFLTCLMSFLRNTLAGRRILVSVISVDLFVCFCSLQMSDDQDGCEWVSVSSGTGLPG